MKDGQNRKNNGGDDANGPDERLLMRFQLRIDPKRLALLGGLVLLVLTISNYLVQRSYDRLGRDLQSIYADRLVPSNYLFRLQALLVRKKLIQEHGDLNKAEKRTELANIAAEMDSLIFAYDLTYLTEEEKREWNGFRQSLTTYDSLEQQWRVSVNALTLQLSTAIDESFQQSLSWLSQLNRLQTTEGSRIKEKGLQRIHSATMQSYIRISLVVILLALGVSLIMATNARPPGREEIYN